MKTLILALHFIASLHLILEPRTILYKMFLLKIMNKTFCVWQNFCASFILFSRSSMKCCRAGILAAHRYSILCYTLGFKMTFLYCECIPTHAGSTRANRREPKSCLGWVFSFKLGCSCYEWNTQARSYLKLKTQPRFHPFNLNLSVS